MSRPGHINSFKLCRYNAQEILQYSQTAKIAQLSGVPHQTPLGGVGGGLQRFIHQYEEVDIENLTAQMDNYPRPEGSSISLGTNGVVKHCYQNEERGQCFEFLLPA